MRRAHILASAAVLTIAAAVFQIALGLNPGWSSAFGAPAWLVERPTMLFAASVLVAALFAGSAAYAAAGAGYLRGLPLLRSALVIIGVVFLLRGLVAVPLLLAVFGWGRGLENVPRPALWSSAAFLLLALLYLGGALANWRSLNRPVDAGPSAVRAN
jgi:hypothetical protein